MQNKWLKFVLGLVVSSMAPAVFSAEVTAEFALYNIRQLDTPVYYQVFDCKETEQKKWQDLGLISSGSLIPNAKTEKVRMQVKQAPFCIRVYQDLNQNGQLDYGDSGVPIEPVGFSNNPNLMLGYPAPHATAYRNDSASLNKIKLNYRRRLR